MSAFCAGRRFCFSALWCRSPYAGRARNLRKLQGQLQYCITYCDSQERHGGGGSPEAPRFPTSALGIRRRSLSPLDRVSGLIPPECISQELRDLQSSEPPSLSSLQDDLSPSSSLQDDLSPSSSLQDDLSPSSSLQDDLSPSSSLQDDLSPSSSLQDDLSPSSSLQDDLSPSSSLQDDLSPSSSLQDDLSPSSSLQDDLSPSSSLQDDLSPSSSLQDDLSPSSSLQDDLSPSSSLQDDLSPSSSLQDDLSPLALSCQEGAAPVSPERLPFPSLQEGNASPNLYSPPESSPPWQGNPFQPGELLMAEYKRRSFVMFKKMFVLKNSGSLVSHRGAINYKDLLGRLPGEKVRTSSGLRVLVKRPSLDEYVLKMKRGPTISYPKDIASMLLMMDVNPGDVILEAGSGSGALSLFLSRAVGPDGCVHSVEVRSDHHSVSKNNFLTWKSAWEMRSGRCWPDNVNFINKDVLDAMSDLKSVAFDAVALDMLNPHAVLPAIVGNLKQGAVCVVYVTNITQVIDLFEGIRSCQLPLLREKVMQVGVTNWVVTPSLQKDGRISKRVKPPCNVTSEDQTPDQSDDDEDDSMIYSQPFGQVPYIARPLPWQLGHTAFLVQLRKFKAVADVTELGDPS